MFAFLVSCSLKKEKADVRGDKLACSLNPMKNGGIGPGGLVAVIGAGAAGLCAAKNLRDYGLNFRVTVFEGSNAVGGTWNYTEKLDTHSSMYKSLHTNLPKEIMAYPSLPFDDKVPSFPHRSHVVEYLQEYAAVNDLKGLIRFNTEVTHLRQDDRTEKWLVTSHATDGREGDREESFDAVLLCNGHYHVPHIPHLPGADLFQGRTLHSHNYREPGSFRGQTVVVLGAGPSGVDISLEISTTAKFVLLSHRGYKSDAHVRPNMEQRPPIARFGDDGHSVVFEDGRQQAVDAIVFCTGYEYDFPFLDPSVGVRVVDRVVQDLYQHLIFIRRPTLSFIGLLWKVVPFPLMDYQTRFVTGVLSGRITLPTEEEMFKELHDEQVEMKEQPDRYFHMLADRQWEYNRWLADRAGATPLPPVVQSVYSNSSRSRRTMPLDYRRQNYEIEGEGEHQFRVIKDGKDITSF